MNLAGCTFCILLVTNITGYTNIHWGWFVGLIILNGIINTGAARLAKK
jgi:hypothetical protein